jgi:hypothetical protein
VRIATSETGTCLGAHVTSEALQAAGRPGCGVGPLKLSSGGTLRRRVWGDSSYQDEQVSLSCHVTVFSALDGSPSGQHRKVGVRTQPLLRGVGVNPVPSARNCPLIGHSLGAEHFEVNKSLRSGAIA